MCNSVGEVGREVVGASEETEVDARVWRNLTIDGWVFGFGFGLLTLYIDPWILSHLLGVMKDEKGGVVGEEEGGATLRELILVRSCLSTRWL